MATHRPIYSRMRLRPRLRYILSRLLNKWTDSKLRSSKAILTAVKMGRVHYEDVQMRMMKSKVRTTLALAVTCGTGIISTEFSETHILRKCFQRFLQCCLANWNTSWPIWNSAKWFLARSSDVCWTMMVLNKLVVLRGHGSSEFKHVRLKEQFRFPCGIDTFSIPWPSPETMPIFSDGTRRLF